MRRLLLAGLAIPLSAFPLLAQTTTPAPVAPLTTGVPDRAPIAGAPATAPMPGSATSAVPQPSTTVMPATPTGGASGANSFTEGQARSRLEANGFTGVSALTKGDDGVWRGSAMKNGKSSQVGVDYKGDISGG